MKTCNSILCLFRKEKKRHNEQRERKCVIHSSVAFCHTCIELMFMHHQCSILPVVLIIGHKVGIMRMAGLKDDNNSYYHTVSKEITHYYSSIPRELWKDGKTICWLCSVTWCSRCFINVTNKANHSSWQTRHHTHYIIMVSATRRQKIFVWSAYKLCSEHWYFHTSSLHPQHILPHMCMVIMRLKYQVSTYILVLSYCTRHWYSRNKMLPE